MDGDGFGTKGGFVVKRLPDARKHVVTFLSYDMQLPCCVGLQQHGCFVWRVRDFVGLTAGDCGAPCVFGTNERAYLCKQEQAADRRRHNGDRYFVRMFGAPDALRAFAVS
jgi:hypothetical protein